MKFKTIIMDDVAVERAVKRISHEIIEKNKGVAEVVLLGIVTRGVPLAEKIRENVLAIEGKEVSVGKVDITLYRDDLSEIADLPKINGTEVNFNITGKDVVLCDDVIYTGRTVRAAIDAVMRLGRPKTIQLAVLIDRGHRELPIRPDYVGKNVPTAINEVISVKFASTDNQTRVDLSER
ncbi:MAG: bifunctional pyr operon transcriptional regulator/uracil phosphoribosyltransferase PyrR [Clostridia bacterium]|nr:bifunctional pyr operon transcriptional regulator/uracil phosphoribosyltransferase PyrR [Clostridia bacterium]